MVHTETIKTEQQTGSSLYRLISPPITLRTSPPPKPQTAVNFTIPPPHALNSKFLSYHQAPQKNLSPQCS